MSILRHNMSFTSDRIAENGTMKSIEALIRDGTGSVVGILAEPRFEVNEISYAADELYGFLETRFFDCCTPDVLKLFRVNIEVLQQSGSTSPDLEKISHVLKDMNYIISGVANDCITRIQEQSEGWGLFSSYLETMIFLGCRIGMDRTMMRSWYQELSDEHKTRFHKKFPTI